MAPTTSPAIGGEYAGRSGRPRVTVQHFAEMWGRISNNFGGAPAVLGYGLMNEPVGLEAAEGLRPAEMWEKASQAALDRIRGNGDRKFVLVPGYEWSGVQTWTRTHPDAWINDPANRFLYEAHHYFDGDHSGTYKRTFAEETLASARGSARVKVRSGFDL
jgi:endoglucanase